MVDYPAHGSANWDVPLKAYIDAQDANVLAESLSEMRDLVADEIDRLVIEDLGTSDGQVKTLIESPSSQTAAALNAAYVSVTTRKPNCSPPSGFRGFSRVAMPTIRRRMGRFEVDLSTLESLRPTGGVTYYVAPDGATGASGLSASTPTTVATAIAKPDVGTIVYAPGEYFRNNHSVSTSVAHGSIRHVAGGSGVFLTSFENPTSLTWTPHSGHVYSTTRTGTVGVYDTSVRTPWGDYTAYVQRGSAEEIVGPGEWAFVGSTLYVWALGDAVLSDPTARQKLRVSLGLGKAGYTRDNSVQWIEGIEFHGGNSAYQSGTNAASNAVAVLFDCTFRYGQTNAVSMTGGRAAIFVRCEASSSGADGFNYHDTLGHGMEFIEVDCWAHHNGLSSPGTNNSSSAHEAVTGIRVGGLYEYAAGPVVADVNSSHTWNLGCHAAGQGVSVSSAQRQSWRTDGTSAVNGKGIAKMWLDECSSDTAEFAFAATNGASIYVHAHSAGNPSLRPASSAEPLLYAR